MRTTTRDANDDDDDDGGGATASRDANGAVVALSAALPTDPDAVAALASSTFFRPV